MIKYTDHDATYVISDDGCFYWSEGSRLTDESTLGYVMELIKNGQLLWLTVEDTGYHGLVYVDTSRGRALMHAYDAEFDIVLGHIPFDKELSYHLAVS